MPRGFAFDQRPALRGEPRMGAADCFQAHGLDVERRAQETFAFLPLTAAAAVALAPPRRRGRPDDCRAFVHAVQCSV
jgi:hypothetical protein